LLLVPVWILVYIFLDEIADLLIYKVFQMTPETHLTESIWFFIYEVPKVMLLLVLIIFLVGIIRTYFSAEKTRKALEGKSLFTGNVTGILAWCGNSILFLFCHPPFPWLC